MRWLVKHAADQAAKGRPVTLPDGIVDGEALLSATTSPLPGIDMAVWNRAQQTLILSTSSGVERNIRVRAHSLQSFDGEAATQLSAEYTSGSTGGVRSFTGTVELHLPGQAHRGRSEAGKALVVRSQITGKIIKILTKVGDRVAAGDTLMIIEAMKMENRIFASQAGVISQIAVKEGDSVATGKELVRLSDQ